TSTEHCAVPVPIATVRVCRNWDPLAAFGFLAAQTTSIRFATHVLVLGYHHPLAIAKRYGTLDVVSGGRLILGVGVGSLEEEFALLDAPFAERGARADDAMRALRAALSQREPEYAGEYYEFSEFLVDPCAVQTRVPLWVGGRTARSLRRAVEFADGWAPFGLSLDDIGKGLTRARETEAWNARRGTFDVILPTDPPLDPMGAPQVTADTVAAYADAGATMLNVRVIPHSPSHYVEQLEALRTIV